MNDTPPEKNGNSFEIKDVFGIGKITEAVFHKLPLNKLSARMAYCMCGALILLVVTTYLAVYGTKIPDFPTAGDIRASYIVCVIILFVGMWDILFKKK